jgi:hypothetical protein
MAVGGDPSALMTEEFTMSRSGFSANKCLITVLPMIDLAIVAPLDQCAQVRFPVLKDNIIS